MAESKVEDLLADILKELQRGGGSGGAQGAAAARRGAMASGKGGGGLLGAGSVMGLAKKIPGLAAAATVAGGAAAAGKVLGGGLVNSSRGGTFAGGATRSLLEAADKALPFGLGEAGGFSGSLRIAKGAEGDLNSRFNEIARFAGANAVRPEIRQAAAAQAIRQNKNVEEDRKANSALITEEVAKGNTTEAGTVAAELITAIKGVIAMFNALTSSAPKTAG